MGIKGIYRELGPGKRVSLAKLAAESFEKADRPFRLAIDIAIWQFQNQAARGGTNPAIRTLFYRLVRLLGTPIQPVFVFDGPNKPKFKRNKRSGRADGVATAQAKRLIRLFGFVTHDAPGEAEAECAFLQRNGAVDAVLSEDVDTIMFGCTRTLRNWSSESGSSKTPTHVSMYDVDAMQLASLGLDREGMVLVALMSGGDYLPEGVPGCGVKVACEAARGGFGKSVCRLKSSDTDGIRRWRESLTHELRTNERGVFRTRHKALTVPEDFPSVEVLRYYTHPVVSQQAALAGVRQRMAEGGEVQLAALREFARETFDWDYREGAVKFIRVLGGAMLVNTLGQGSGREELVRRISGRRQHGSTDGSAELRLAYVPEEVVPIDLSREVEEDVAYGRDGLALNSDDEFEEPAGVTTGGGKVYDVTKPDLAWVLEAIVRRSAPRTFEAWEEAQRGKAKSKTAEKEKKKKKKVAAPNNSVLDGFVRITKPKTSDAAEKMARALCEEAPLPALPRLATGTSKHSLPTAAEPVKGAISRSPVTPRPRAEAISIPSSPATDVATDVGASRGLPAPESVVARAQDVDVRPSPASRVPRLTQTSMDMFTRGKKRLTQTSMDMFTTKLTTPVDDSGNQTHDDSEDDVICLSDPDSPNAKESRRGRRGPGKKTVLVPGALGFLEEVEVSEEEYEERVARERRGLESRGIRGERRMSQVACIDLTGD